MNKRFFKTLEIVGVFVIYIVAVILHFVYDFTNGSTLSIIFGAVNESVWEHVKIFAAAFVLWSMIELLWLRPRFKRFVVTKVISLSFLGISIIAFFYTYNLFVSSPILFLDIASSIAFVALSQYLSYRLYIGDRELEMYFPVSVMLLLLYFVMFFSFTVFPPKIDLFRDPESSMYGIIEDYIDAGAFYLDKI